MPSYKALYGEDQHYLMQWLPPRNLIQAQLYPSCVVLLPLLPMHFSH